MQPLRKRAAQALGVAIAIIGCLPLLAGVGLLVGLWTVELQDRRFPVLEIFVAMITGVAIIQLGRKLLASGRRS